MIMYPGDSPDDLRPRPLFNLIALLIPLLGTCTCFGLLGNIEQGGGPHSQTGLKIAALSYVLGLVSALTAALRRESYPSLTNLALLLNLLPCAVILWSLLGHR